MASVKIKLNGTDNWAELNFEVDKFDGFDELVNRIVNRRKTRTECVRDMFIHVLPHQERNDKPTVPSEAAIRLQTRIDAEEFVEKMEALYDDRALVDMLRTVLGRIAIASPIRKDLHARLPDFADALADNAVTNEGFAVLFGIDLEPVFALVNEANMQKKDGPIVAGKKMKPEGWKAPDVAGELVRQGWEPSVAAKVWHGIPHTFDSLSIGGNPVQGVGEFLYERPVDPPDGMCTLHGPLNGGDCVRCENAQYNGSEIDPIAEGELALASLATLAKKVETGSQKEPTRHAIPIDSTMWDRSFKIELKSARVQVNDFSWIDCRVVFFGVGQDRRCMIEMPATNWLIGQYESLRQYEEVCSLFIADAYLGSVRTHSVELGGTASDRLMQVEFTKTNPRKTK
jgi:predicted HAD superfamily Cof-like phosphohydrolase